MIDEVKLRNTYGLSRKEYEAICKRTDELLTLEEKSRIVTSRCDGTLQSTEKWLRKRLSEDESKRCLDFFKNNGGYCNCEILFNVLPRIREIQKDVQTDED